MCSTLSGELIWLCFIRGKSQKVMCKGSRMRARIIMSRRTRTYKWRGNKKGLRHCFQTFCSVPYKMEPYSR